MTHTVISTLVAHFHRFRPCNKYTVCVCVCLMTVCIYWCVSSIYCCALPVSKVTADAQRSAYSWHLSFLLSVRITRAQCHERLSIPLAEDTEATRSEDEAVWIGEMAMCLRGREEEREGGDHEMTARELELSTGICLTFSWSCPRALPVTILGGKNLFSIYFGVFFGSLAGYLYIHLCRHWCLRGEPWSASH